MSRSSDQHPFSGEHEHQIIQGLHSGEEAVFKAIYIQYSPTLYDYCFSITDHQQEAEDIVTESFVNLFNAKSTVDSITTIRQFLFQKAKHLCLTYLRNEKRKSKHHLQILKGLEAAEDSLISYLVRSEHRRQLLQAISLLSPLRQRVINELINDGLSVKDLAIELNLKEQTIYSAKEKAVQHLRKILNKGTAFVIIFMVYILLTIIDLAKRFFSV